MGFPTTISQIPSVSPSKYFYRHNNIIEMSAEKKCVAVTSSVFHQNLCWKALMSDYLVYIMREFNVKLHHLVQRWEFWRQDLGSRNRSSDRTQAVQRQGTGAGRGKVGSGDRKWGAGVGRLGDRRRGVSIGRIVRSCGELCRSRFKQTWDLKGTGTKTTPKD